MDLKNQIQNREIKFRALKDDMSDFRFVYGNLIYDHKDNPRIQEDRNEPTFITCIKGTECQYTGFKDFDGKEIYEGDILEYVSYMRDENKRKEIVEFDEKCGGWYVHKQADTLADVLFKQHNEDWQIKQNYKPSIKHKVRVIGNIYETPEFTQTTS